MFCHWLFELAVKRRSPVNNPVIAGLSSMGEAWICEKCTSWADRLTRLKQRKTSKKLGKGFFMAFVGKEVLRGFIPEGIIHGNRIFQQGRRYAKNPTFMPTAGWFFVCKQNQSSIEKPLWKQYLNWHPTAMSKSTVLNLKTIWKSFQAGMPEFFYLSKVIFPDLINGLLSRQ